jgi:murein L,D-transpeptidase YcbB/YkuD
MELFYLRKFAEAYHINIVSDYSECPDNDALFFMDNWYSTFWTAELLWNEPKNNTASLMKQRQAQYEKALDRHFFEVDFSLCEQLLAFNSLKVISLTEVDFWRPVVYDAYSEYMEEIPAHNPANNRFVLTQALALEETLQLLLETAEIRNDAVLYFTLFATQRAGFIALKNLLQESLSQQTTEPETIQETITLLLETIRHLQEVHEILWNIENASPFPPAIVQQYEGMIFELTKVGGE